VIYFVAKAGGAFRKAGVLGNESAIHALAAWATDATRAFPEDSLVVG
jgi:hypothetical protein